MSYEYVYEYMHGTFYEYEPLQIYQTHAILPQYYITTPNQLVYQNPIQTQEQVSTLAFPVSHNYVDYAYCYRPSQVQQVHPQTVLVPELQYTFTTENCVVYTPNIYSPIPMLHEPVFINTDCSYVNGPMECMQLQPTNPSASTEHMQNNYSNHAENNETQISGEVPYHPSTQIQEPNFSVALNDPCSTENIVQQQSTLDLKKNVLSILNKVTVQNKIELTKKFKKICIDTIDDLYKTVDLICQKAFDDYDYAPLYASLFSAIQFQKVSRKSRHQNVTFRSIMAKRHNRLFVLSQERGIGYEDESMEKINIKKNGQQIKDMENDRRQYKRFVGYCRFIGELFNHKIVNSSSIIHKIIILTKNPSDLSLESLCVLLKTAGKKLVCDYNMNQTINKLIKISTNKNEYNLKPRTIFMLRDIIDLSRSNWISKPESLDEYNYFLLLNQ